MLNQLQQPKLTKLYYLGGLAPEGATPIISLGQSSMVLPSVGGFIEVAPEIAPLIMRRYNNDQNTSKAPGPIVFTDNDRLAKMLLEGAASEESAPALANATKEELEAALAALVEEE